MIQPSSALRFFFAPLREKRFTPEAQQKKNQRRKELNPGFEVGSSG
jgi:hypothetical protein